MAKKPSRESVKRIKTGGLERRISITSAGVIAGTRMATQYATSFLGKKSTRSARRSKAMSKQAQYFVDELGKLKGSVVKIGQILAIYGEHFLPEEVTEALHTLESETAPLHWPAMKKVLIEELGKEKLAELKVEPKPIGAASLAQVHRAPKISDGTVLCLKIQYPGVADAIDADLNDVASILKLAKLVKMGSSFDEWLEEVREMMYREVDYGREKESMDRFRTRLKGDSRFIIPKVYPRYSTSHVLAMSYEFGYPVNAPEAQEISQARRNKLGASLLELFLQEVFEWGELQTDPNFGNFYIRPASSNRAQDHIVLLDFGAVEAYPDRFMNPLRDMIRAAYAGDLKGVEEGSIQLGFMKSSYPRMVRRSFAEACIEIVEPLTCEQRDLPEHMMNKDGQYCWRASELPLRIGKLSAKAPFAPYFAIPPREFVFLSRKLAGVYTMIAVLDAQFNGGPLFKKFL